VNTQERARLSEDVLRRLAAAMRSTQLYAPGHPIVARAVTSLTDALTIVLATTPSIAIGLVGDELVVGDTPVPRATDTMGELMRRLQQAGIERIVFDRGVDSSEIASLVHSILRADEGTEQSLAGRLPHVRVGRLEVEQRVATSGTMATFRSLYDDAVSLASRLWDSASVEGMPDADAARGMVESLAQAVAQNRTALMALTALKEYDNYTFTHMVNVSILTMGQARGLGIEGTLLRELGLAALMHDIGKVNTPNEILNKPEALTTAEFEILKRHTIDGAEILRRTPEIPALAPVVAFEHHLRADGTGYPGSVRRPQLNLGTVLCGIADVYDAMRSQRAYQQAFPTDRILAVLKRNDGTQFDQHLVRRFTQLVGIYPVGNLVRLDSGEVAVVLQVYAPDPYRPRVRVLIGPDGAMLDQHYDVNLWEPDDGKPESAGRSIQAPLDPAAYGIDPLAHLG
jgi:putative nucleotidyltransferase with HDIG domain